MHTRQRRTAFLVVALMMTARGARAQAGAPAAQNTSKYQIEARVMFWADTSGRGSVPDQEETIDDFFVRRARLIFQARPSPSVTIYLQIGQDNIGSEVLKDDGSIRIKDASMNYRAADALQFTAGQFKIPFLRASLESGFNQLLVDRGTLPSLRPAREGSRDLGAMAWGNKAGFQYRLAVFDGSDQETSNPESHLRTSMRAAYNWFSRETGLSYTGSYLGKTRVLHVAAQLDRQDSRLDSRDESGFQSRLRDYRAYAFEAFFEQPFAGASTLTVDGAWLDRRDDYVEAGVATRDLDGYYLQSGFLLPGNIGPGRLQFAVRREDWTIERGVDEATNTRTAAGITYYLKDHDRKLQTDYTVKRETPEITNNEWRLSVVVVF